MNLQEVRLATHLFEDTEYGTKMLIRETSHDAITVELLLEEVIQNYITSNPLVAGFATYWAITRLKDFEQKRRKTTTIFAKNMQDKALYQRIIDDLLATGHYKLTKTKHVEGGVLWVSKLND